MKTEEYITLNQASEILGIKKPNLYRLAKNGELPIYKKGSQSIVKLSDVEKIKKERNQIRPLYDQKTDSDFWYAPFNWVNVSINNINV